MGKRGLMPGTGGRPPKALAEKIGAGNPGKRPLMVMGAPETATLECVEMPAPKGLHEGETEERRGVLRRRYLHGNMGVAQRARM